MAVLVPGSQNAEEGKLAKLRALRVRTVCTKVCPGRLLAGLGESFSLFRAGHWRLVSGVLAPEVGQHGIHLLAVLMGSLSLY